MTLVFPQNAHRWSDGRVNYGSMGRGFVNRGARIFAKAGMSRTIHIRNRHAPFPDFKTHKETHDLD